MRLRPRTEQGALQDPGDVQAVTPGRAWAAPRVDEQADETYGKGRITRSGQILQMCPDESPQELLDGLALR